ncbi:hypothetical protein IPZ69_42980, partial [Streptomyces olivochromogenes]|nr:hypothetical protein [Streptomyces olivochromogenes]
MSQQGGRPTRQDDDWWGELYDDSTEDTGATATGDSVDDRFASASDTLGGRRGAGRQPRDADEGPPRPRAPW